jgi:hypothetical protein
MPNIDLITPVKYDSLWPYHSQYDNLPLEYILARQSLINTVVDQNTAILEESEGTMGTLANRLAQSIEDNGDLKTSAIDQALHDIEEHTDSVNYVRMEAAERAKLILISDEATALQIQFETISETVLFDDELVTITDSPTVTWNVESPSTITANFAFPTSAAHEHNYGVVPYPEGGDYINYATNVSYTPYIEGSLRVFINGIRLNEDHEVYVYNADDGPSGTWLGTSFTGDYGAGTFYLNRAIDPADSIIIDFDRSLA